MSAPRTLADIATMYADAERLLPALLTVALRLADQFEPDQLQLFLEEFRAQVLNG